MGKLPENSEFNENTMQANFSAFLYVVTEQEALIGRLLQTLLETKVISAHQLNKVTDITSGEEGLVPTYNQVYNRFAKYYLRTKFLLDKIDEHGPEEVFDFVEQKLKDKKGDDDE